VNALAWPFASVRVSTFPLASVGGLVNMVQGVGHRKKPADVVEAVVALPGRLGRSTVDRTGQRRRRSERSSCRLGKWSWSAGCARRRRTALCGQRVGRRDAPPVGIVSLGCALAQRVSGSSPCGPRCRKCKW